MATPDRSGPRSVMSTRGHGTDRASPLIIVFEPQVPLAGFFGAAGRIDIPRPEMCPACGCGRLVFDGWRPRQTRQGRVSLHRVLCRGRRCRERSHSLLPGVLVAGRVDLVRVIGWALEQKAAGLGYRPIARAVGVPPATVRGWFRCAGRRGMAVASRLWGIAASADPGVRSPPEGSAVATLLAACGLAGEALARLSGDPQDRWSVAVAATGGPAVGLIDTICLFPRPLGRPGSRLRLPEGPDPRKEESTWRPISLLGWPSARSAAGPRPPERPRRRTPRWRRPCR